MSFFKKLIVLTLTLVTFHIYADPAITNRDPLKWPFSSTSIWNTPIGTGAIYVPANLPADPRNDPWAPMPQIDDEYIVTRPVANMVQINYSSAAWNGVNRCTSTGTTVTTLVSVPVPDNFVVPNNTANNSAAFILADGRTIIQSQPFTRCTAGQYATSLLTFPTTDLYGDGMYGAHGGSGLSAIGGSLRVGELRPGLAAPRHVLKVNVDSAVVMHPCVVRTDCGRWPSKGADSYAASTTNGYGYLGTNQPAGMKMGALLAIPASIDINSIGLESQPGLLLAWTLQNYGAYVVDSTGGGAFAIEAENGPDGSLRTQFQSDWGYPLEARVRDNTPWVRDLQRIIVLLNIVDNNTAATPGGGGAPLQPLAPSLVIPN